VGGSTGVHGDDGWLEPYRAVTARIIAEATSKTTAWTRLAELTDMFPARLSGSANLQRAIDEWTADQMKRDGLDNVRLETVMVPHWVRGSESAEMVEPFQGQLVIAALGGSVGTPPDGVRAEAFVVKSYDDLEAHAAQVKDKIVIYQRRLSHRRGSARRLLTRGDAVPWGRRVARREAGAVAASVRSVGPTAHRSPHTGGMRYSNDAPQIPVAAVSGEDADKLQRMHDRGTRPVIRMILGAKTLPDAEPANGVAELRGREKPDEIVLIGGHIDSWDLASGAMDDAGGVVATWEVVRVLKRLNLVPRRTIRVIAFTNEENGARRPGLPRSAHQRAGEARAGARIGQRRAAAQGLGLQRNRQGARSSWPDCRAVTECGGRSRHGPFRPHRRDANVTGRKRAGAVSGG
jgi:carboxypeptidase Q